MSQFTSPVIHVDNLTQYAISLYSSDPFTTEDYPTLGDSSPETGIILDPTQPPVRFRFAEWGTITSSPISSITSFHFEVDIHEESHQKALLGGNTHISTGNIIESPAQFVGNAGNTTISFNVGNPASNGNLQSPVAIINGNNSNAEQVFSSIRLLLGAVQYPVTITEIRMIVNNSYSPSKVLITHDSGRVTIRAGRVSI